MAAFIALCLSFTVAVVLFLLMENLKQDRKLRTMNDDYITEELNKLRKDLRELATKKGIQQ